jgi:GTP-binding protein Era
VERLEGLILARLAPGPPFFEPHQVTDQPETAIVAELVRQEVFRRTHREVPYQTAVRVERMERMEQQGGRILIEARIFVERDSQKGILIGKGGAMLKAIGSAARGKIEPLLGHPVHLALEVRVLADWSRNPRRLAELGYPEA